MYMYDNVTQSDELRHYGVLGMKWGVRKGQTQKAYTKASKKLQKLNNMADKAQQKSRKAMLKAEKKRYSWFASEEDYEEALAKAQKVQYEANKKIHKAHKWYESMEKVFKDTDVSLSQEQISKGKQWAKSLDMSTELRALLR